MILCRFISDILFGIVAIDYLKQFCDKEHFEWERIF